MAGIHVFEAQERWESQGGLKQKDECDGRTRIGPQSCPSSSLGLIVPRVPIKEQEK